MLPAPGSSLILTDGEGVETKGSQATSPGELG
jgi:hypothetical protein